MEPTRENIDAFTVAGLTVCTANREENDPKTQRIGTLWERFFTEGMADKTPGRTSDACIFGVYSNYESDAHGPFDLTAGVAVEPRADAVPVKAGAFLVFRGTGRMPQTVLATWQRIWNISMSIHRSSGALVKTSKLTKARTESRSTLV